jgi:hypothetical protein
MLNALVSGNVNAYFFWDLIWDSGQRPLVAVEDPNKSSAWKSNKGYIVSDFYYVFKQFANFIDSGFKCVAADADSKEIPTTAFIASDQKQLTVILINQGAAAATTALNPNGFTAAKSTVYLTVPGGAKKCKRNGRAEFGQRH